MTKIPKKYWKEFARAGAKARAQKLTPEERRAIAIKASKAAAKARSAKAKRVAEGD